MRTVNMHEAKTHLPYLVKAADGEFINARAVPSRQQCLLSLKNSHGRSPDHPEGMKSSRPRGAEPMWYSGPDACSFGVAKRRTTRGSP